MCACPTSALCSVGSGRPSLSCSPADAALEHGHPSGKVSHRRLPPMITARPGLTFPHEGQLSVVTQVAVIYLPAEATADHHPLVTAAQGRSWGSPGELPDWEVTSGAQGSALEQAPRPKPADLESPLSSPLQDLWFCTFHRPEFTSCRYGDKLPQINGLTRHGFIILQF